MKFRAKLFSTASSYKAKKITSSFAKENVSPKFTVIHKDSNIIAFLSLIVSIGAIAATIYMQVFFEERDTSVSFVNGTFNDSTFTADIILNNKGNRYSTVLRNTIVFYQNADSLEKNENNGIKFNLKHVERIYNDEFDPVVLSPGQQLYRKIKQPFNFKKIDLKSERILLKDTIQIGLIIGFLNQSGYHSSNILRMGWLKLDSTKQVKKWMLHYNQKKLESDTYWSETFSK